MSCPVLAALASTQPALITQVFSRRGLALTPPDLATASWQIAPCPATHTRSEDASCLFEQRFYQATINGTSFVARINRLLATRGEDILTWVGDYGEALPLMELTLPDFTTILADTRETDLVQALSLTNLPFTPQGIRQATWKTVSSLPEHGRWRRLDIVSWQFFAAEIENLPCVAGAIRTSLFTNSYQLWFGHNRANGPVLGRSLIHNFG